MYCNGTIFFVQSEDYLSLKYVILAIIFFCHCCVHRSMLLVHVPGKWVGGGWGGGAVVDGVSMPAKL